MVLDSYPFVKFVLKVFLIVFAIGFVTSTIGVIPGLIVAGIIFIFMVFSLPIKLLLNLLSTVYNLLYLLVSLLIFPITCVVGLLSGENKKIEKLASEVSATGKIPAPDGGVASSDPGHAIDEAKDVQKTVNELEGQLEDLSPSEQTVEGQRLKDE